MSVNDVSIEKTRAEISKLMAETSRINQQMKYHFWVVAAGYITALVAIIKVWG